MLPIVFSETAPLDLRIVGRMVFHAALVGLSAGAVGVMFFAALEYIQRFLLEDLAGYVPLRASGETFAAGRHPAPFRPWLLVVLPMLGGLGCGLITRLAPEAQGGGGDAMIDAFHRQGGIIRRRVIWVKALASFSTLGTGGAGGREGPTMQIGGALGSAMARLLRVSARERRILLVAGVAAGISAVFRTPLGAALLAVEVLYRDGYESDALIPSLLASVVSYSVVISVFGETTLFAHPSRFPFVPAHLPLFALLALCLALLAWAFVGALRLVRRLARSLPGPTWLRPAIGGLALGLLCTPLIVFVGHRIGQPGQGIGLLGGGYGAVQMAITATPWLPGGWSGVELLALLAVTKLLAAALTIGSGGSAGDFAPSFAIGGLFGGAFGRAAELILNDPRIEPGAFALVGMGVFYGGMAHVPLAALFLVCELAGNYDLLVPLMFGMGVAFVALRKTSLYSAQVPTQRDSPVHRSAMLLDALKAVRVRDVLGVPKPFVVLKPASTADEMLEHVSSSPDQDVFPVVAGNGDMVGLIDASVLRVLLGEGKAAHFALATDIMLPPVFVYQDDDLRKATELLIANDLRTIPVQDEHGQVIALLDEREVARLHLDSEVEPTEAKR
jgi:CIC family chloride channel protein